MGPQVRRLRNQRGWSQEQLAAKLKIAGWDVSRNGLAKIETRIQWMRDYARILAQRVSGGLRRSLPGFTRTAGKIFGR
jgi:transcriptional regulator with XRE-family HTH domain